MLWKERKKYLFSNPCAGRSMAIQTTAAKRQVKEYAIKNEASSEILWPINLDRKYVEK